MARLQQIGFKFGEPAGKKSVNSVCAREYPRNIRAAAVVLNHYYFHLGKVPFGDTRKLILQVPEETGVSDANDTIKCNPLGIGYCSLEYDYGATEKLEGTPLKKSLLDAVHASFMKYCEHYDIPTPPCEAAYKAVLDDDLKFGFYFKKKKKSYRDPDSNKKFFLYVKFDWNELSVIPEVHEARTLLGSAFLYSTTPSVDPWAMLIRKPAWSSSGEILLEPIELKGGTKNCKLSLDRLEEGVKAESLAWSVQNPQPLNV